MQRQYEDSFGLIVRNHILPKLGSLAVSAVERRHVIALHDRLSATPTQANRTLAVLSAMFRLKESKSGARRVPLTPAIEAVLSGIPRAGDNPWVISGRRPGQRIGAIHRVWMRLRVRAGLEDVRLHDLRHSYASRALALGETLPAIGRLLGHSRVETTARYAHLADDSVRQVAIRVSGSIADDILSEDWRLPGAGTGFACALIGPLSRVRGADPCRRPRSSAAAGCPTARTRKVAVAASLSALFASPSWAR